MKNAKDSGLTKQGFRLLRLERREVIWILQLVAPTLLGIILPRATVFGTVAPFGVGLVASATGPITIPTFIATVLGYILAPASGTLRYLATLVAIIGIRWSAAGFPRVSRSVWFAPTVAFLGTVITGSALRLSGNYTIEDIIIVISESILCGGFAFFCQSIFNRNSISNIETVRLSIIVVLAIALMSLYTVMWQSISLGRIVSVFALMMISRCGFKEGCVAGILFGITAFLFVPDSLYFVPFFTLSGFLCGWFFRAKTVLLPLITTTAYVITVAVSFTAMEVLQFVVGIYEILAAGALIFLVPKKILELMRFYLVLEKSKKEELSDVRRSVSEKMISASESMSTIAGTLNKISKHFAAQRGGELGSMYLSVGEAVCNSCKHKVSCWSNHFFDCMDSLNSLTVTLKNQGCVSAEDISGYLYETCPKLEDICSYVNCHYPEYLLREETFHRLQELRYIVNDQFENVSRILSDFSKQLSTAEWRDEGQEKQIASALTREGFTVKRVVCIVNEDGRKEIELVMNKVNLQEQKTMLTHIVEKNCNRVFSNQQIENETEETRVFFSEGQAFRVVIGSSQSKCKGEKLCGDAFEIFRDPNGKQYIVLSDGMGTGGRAAVDSAITAGLTSELLRAGFGYESVLRLVNTALIAKSDDETLSTLDVACINLFTGELDLLKAGAGASLLLSKTRISRFEESSLPLGILHELDFSRACDRLSDGDVLLMMSDGVSNDGLRWVEDLLRTFDCDEGNVQELSETIIKTALRMHQNEKGDDMTVIAVKIEKLNIQDLPL